MDTQEYISPMVELEPEEEKSPFDRFAEVFTAPADAFAGLAGAKKGPIILWGLAIAMVVGIFAAVIVTTNSDAREAIREKSRAQLEKQHDAGKIDDKTFEQQSEVMDTMMSGTMFMVFGVVGAAVSSVFFAVIIGTIVLILVRVLQRDKDPSIGFGAALAATVIAFMIQNIEAIVSTVGILLTSNLEFRIAPTLLMSPENPFLKFALNLIDPFTIWLWFVLGTGIAVLARAERLKAVVAIAIAWIVGGLILTGIGSIFTFTAG